MSYFRSFCIFVMGFLSGSVLMSGVVRGHFTDLEMIALVVYAVFGLMFAIMQGCKNGQ